MTDKSIVDSGASVVELERTSTGVPGIDALMYGGLPTGQATLLAGTSGTGKTIFGLGFLRHGIASGEPAVFVTCEESVPKIMKWAATFGWDLTAATQAAQLRFVDVSITPDEEVVSISGTFDLRGLIARIRAAVDAVGAKRVVIDSIGVMFEQLGTSASARLAFASLFIGLDEMGVTSLVTVERDDEYGPVARFGIEEFVSDSVVILRNPMVNERRRRTVEVLKLRGGDHHKGEFAYTITSPEGLQSFPLASMSFSAVSTDDRVSTGVPELDRLCGGGVFRDSSVLLSGATGCGKTLAALTFADEACRNGDRALYLGFEESSDQLFRNAAAWGRDI